MASKNIVAKGVTYNGVESITLPVSGGGDATFYEVSDTTATASDVLNSKYFYTASGVKTQGTGTTPSPTLITKSITQNGTYNASSDNADGYSSVTVNVSGGGGGGTPKLGVLNPNAELVKSWNYDKYIIQDEGITIPAYSTSLQTLMASETIETIGANDLDFSSYYYAVVFRGLTTPEYNTDTIDRGRQAFYSRVAYYEFYCIDGTYKEYTSSSLPVTTTYISAYRTGAWYYANDFRYTNSNYGCMQDYTSTRVSITNGAITVTTPVFQICGNAGYFSSTYWNALTDVRNQYIIELYRVPISGSSVNGFALTSMGSHIIDCVNSSSGKLT